MKMGGETILAGGNSKCKDLMVEKNLDYLSLLLCAQ